MSRMMFAFGLAISLTVHLVLLGWGGLPDQGKQKLAQVQELVSVVQLPEAPTEQKAAPAPEPEPEPQPVQPAKAEPQPEPAPDPQPVAEAKPQRAPEPLPLEPIHQATQAELPEAPGDLAGAPQGESKPGLRIDWGNLDHAVQVLGATGGRLVILERPAAHTGMPDIHRELIASDAGWEVRRIAATPGKRFSNRLRIVHDVPAFRTAAHHPALGPHDLLAVMLPSKVERMLETAQLTAAYQSGVRIEQVHSFAGAFAISGPQLGFHITHIHTKDALP